MGERDDSDAREIQDLEAENERLREDLELQRKIDLQIIAEKQQLRQELSLAEEGLANYAQENQRLRDALNQAKERAYAEYGRLCEAVRPEPQS